MDLIIWNGGTPDVDQVVWRYLGAYKIAHAARKVGFCAQVVDHVAFFDLETLYKATKKFITPETRIIAVSTTWMMERRCHIWPDGSIRRIPHHVNLCMKMLQAEHPNITWVAGGYNASLANRDTLPVDILVDGYGEAIMVELLEHVQGRGNEPCHEPVYSMDDRSYQRKCYVRPSRLRHDICEDDHVFRAQDCIQPGETLPIEVSRGCVFRCRFCHHTLLGRRKLDYLRDVELVKNEMLANHSNWGTSRYYIICDTFNDTPEKMSRWHGMVTSLPFDVEYHAYLRTDLLDRYPDVPHQLLESGLRGSYHGIESLGEQASLVAGKAWSGRHARSYVPRLLNDIWKGQVMGSLSFIAGLPGDTRQSLLETIDWLQEFQPYHAMFQPLSIFPQPGWRHRSEFDINHASYGYRFAGGDMMNWHLDHWNRNQVVEFVATRLQPRLKNFVSYFSSWTAFCLLGMGHDARMADRAWQRSQSGGYEAMLPALKQHKNKYLQNYLSDLMNL